jgi:hypothetical protein
LQKELQKLKTDAKKKPKKPKSLQNCNKMEENRVP